MEQFELNTSKHRTYNILFGIHYRACNICELHTHTQTLAPEITKHFYQNVHSLHKNQSLRAVRVLNDA